ncbi:MAG: phosphohistidine phosphatase SixA [Anaerolineales bacterium]|nr:phosphohistidine phosphatase SixA [Anaerolineales bacterium]
MHLYLIRHAIAVEEGAPGYEDDSLRPLTDKGKKKMRQIAKGLRALGADFDLIVSSPYVRAKETAEILADVFDLDAIEFNNMLVPDGDPNLLISDINEKYKVDSLVLVGHQPFLSSLIGLLVAENAAVDVTFKKGGVCRLSADNLLHDRRAVLEWLLTPGILVDIGNK